jgi:hypothetical protein
MSNKWINAIVIEATLLSTLIAGEEKRKRRGKKKRNMSIYDCCGFQKVSVHIQRGARV